MQIVIRLQLKEKMLKRSQPSFLQRFYNSSEALHAEKSNQYVHLVFGAIQEHLVNLQDDNVDFMLGLQKLKSSLLRDATHENPRISELNAMFCEGVDKILSDITTKEHSFSHAGFTPKSID